MTEHIKEYPGTYVKERAFTDGSVLQTWWYPKADYAWDEGVAIGRFLAGLKEGHILGITCPQCHRVLVPPRMVCEHCFVPTSNWVELPGTGYVKTFSIVTVRWDMERLETPLIPAVIALDGTEAPNATGGFMHLLGEIDPKPEVVRIGMRVEPVWAPPRKRTAAITDILYFRPIKEGKR
jgi:uncharacterized OB-fold protein